LPINLAVVIARVAVRTERNEVLERMDPYLRPRHDMRDFGRSGVTGSERSTGGQPQPVPTASAPGGSLVGLHPPRTEFTRSRVSALT